MIVERCMYGVEVGGADALVFDRAIAAPSSACEFDPGFVGMPDLVAS